MMTKDGTVKSSERITDDKINWLNIGLTVGGVIILSIAAYCIFW